MWRERNNRLYNHVEETEAQSLDHIKGAVCMHLHGLKNIAAGSVNLDLCSAWGVNSATFS